ncbi:uncharacterized protein [Amphiura filiformis]|uniref:uncharacterized protein n=1 Tax=Amphiura filiformis TaxID=82378 RepID=UPI003B2109DD
MFDVIVKATKSLSGKVKQKTKNGIQMSKSPSYGLQVGHSIRKCVMLKIGRAIRLRDKEMKLEAQEFDLLYSNEWTDKVSSPALQTLLERKYYKEEEIPDSSDLAKLNAYSSQKVTEGIKCLHEEPNQNNWTNLSKALFVACTVFNHRRSGEVAEMPIASFTKRPARGKVNGEILNSLTSLERKLLQRFDVLQLRGKQNRKVPLLLKNEWVKAMELLTQRRNDCGIKTANIYFFAGGGKGPINGWQILHDFATSANCQNPKLISTTRIRKYCATVIQLLGLTLGETEWLANHLGHDINIHRDVYRLHESSIEVSKISRLLLAIESGEVAKYKGRELKDIGVSEIPIEEDSGDEEEEENAQAENSIDNEAAGTDTAKVSSVSSDSEVVRQRPRKKKCRKIDDDSSDSSDSEEVLRQRPRKKKRKRRKINDSSDSEEHFKIDDGNRKKPKRRWTEEELSIFDSIVGPCIKKKTMPTRHMLDRVAEKIAHSRTIAQIRTRAHNVIKGKQ